MRAVQKLLYSSLDFVFRAILTSRKLDTFSECFTEPAELSFGYAKMVLESFEIMFLQDAIL